LDRVLEIPKQLDKKDQQKKPKPANESGKPEEKEINVDEIDEGLKTMTEMYFNGQINEDEVRLKLHRERVDDIEAKLDERIKEGTDVRNFYVMDRFKDNVQEYINFSRSEQFAKESTSYAKTQDNMRVDFGIVISRPPIFLTYLSNVILVSIKRIWSLVNSAELLSKSTSITLIKSMMILR
jgi:hypothetical protein